MLSKVDIFAISLALDLEGAQNVDGTTGYMSNLTLSTQYRFFENFSVGLGLNSYLLDFNIVRKIDYDLGLREDIIGLNAFASLHF
ncbi:hypothetical protein JHD50_02890 [Sulfurimonas sp. MAG313]|nr:hypothetical protein [Sulfurimonas sp. MAG313]MDF1880258.1 hypothetical protein [Sulfurimonas sp. MAG313]